MHPGQNHATPSHFLFRFVSRGAFVARHVMPRMRHGALAGARERTKQRRATSVARPRNVSLVGLTPKERRMFLVKQEMASVMTSLDLTGHDRLIAVLSTNKSRLDKCRRARERFGEDPAAWLPEFYRLLEPGDLSVPAKEQSNAA